MTLQLRLRIGLHLHTFRRRSRWKSSMDCLSLTPVIRQAFCLMMLVALPLLPLAGPVLGQENNSGENVPKVRVLPPAYDAEMLRLSEILGALHYLRELCGAEEGQLWRDQMQEMITREEPTAERRAQMIARFNHGFRGFRETYRECTVAAREANDRYIEEGARISLQIPSRFGR